MNQRQPLSQLRALRPHAGRAARLAPLAAILALAAAVLACIPAAVAKPAGAAPLRYRDETFSTVTVTRDLTYGSAAGIDAAPVALTLDLYQPEGDEAAARPAVIWVHGGAYAGGDKGRGPSAILAEKFAKLGYVSVSINYRLLATQNCNADGGISAICYAAGVAAVHDAQAAVRWLRANAATYRIDPDKIAIGGESAGGITAAGVGVYANEPGDSGNPGYPSNVNAWVSISGGMPGGIFVDAGDAPGFLFSGTADPTVPYQWSVETADAMQAAGVPVFLKTLDGAGHVPWVEYHDLFETQSDYFLYDFLDLGAAAR